MRGVGVGRKIENERENEHPGINIVEINWHKHSIFTLFYLSHNPTHIY